MMQHAAVFDFANNVIYNWAEPNGYTYIENDLNELAGDPLP
jgi:hypothetical protein